jgi:hypothetical protein
MRCRPIDSGLRLADFRKHLAPGTWRKATEFGNPGKHVDAPIGERLVKASPGHRRLRCRPRETHTTRVGLTAASCGSGTGAT